MLTKMTDAHWIRVLRVFEIVRSRRGDKGRDDRKFPIGTCTTFRSTTCRNNQR